MSLNNKIDYTGRDFASLKEDIRTYLRQKYPDFSSNLDDENSIASVLLDLNALAVDNLNFYIDKQFNEMFITTAQETDKIYRLAHMYGYSPRKKAPARGHVTMSISISDSLWTNGAKALKTNLPSIDIYNSYFSIIADDGNDVRYRFLREVDWNDKTSSFFVDDDGTEVSSRAANSITWTHEIGGSGVHTISARVPVEGSYFSTMVLGPFRGQAFETINLYDDDFHRVFSAHTDWDSGTEHYTGNAFADMWFEVDYMVNPYGFVRKDSVHSGKTRIQTRRRFITRNTSYGTQLVFGYQDRDVLGMTDKADLPTHPLYGGASLGDPYWPLGKRPDAGTEIMCIYLTSKGNKTNIKENALSDSNVTLAYHLSPDDTDIHTPTVVESTAMAGGMDDETVEEIRHNVHSVFLNQERAVTADDYISILKRIPADWGVPIFKAGAAVRDVTIFKDPSSITMTGSSFTHKEIDLYVVKLGSDGKLDQITSTEEQQSVSNYIDHYRMLTDTVYFRRPEIIDINVEYILSVYGNHQVSSTVNGVNEALAEFFHPTNWEFGQPIVYDDIVKLLMLVPGVRNMVSFIVYEDGDVDKTNLLSNREDITNITMIYPHQIYQINQITGDVR